MRVSGSKFLNFTSQPSLPTPTLKAGRGLAGLLLPPFKGGKVGGAYKVEKLAARDSHFLLNIFFIKQFDHINFCYTNKYIEKQTKDKDATKRNKETQRNTKTLYVHVFFLP